jgi:hypothetical protein
VPKPDALRVLAIAIGGRVNRCDHFNSNQGEVERREARGQLNNYRVRVGETASRFALEIRGFETSLAFAVGAPDKICLMDRRLKLSRALARLPVYVSKESAPDETRGWLKVSRHLLALQALGCSQREPLQVYQNGVTLLANSERASRALPGLLVDFADFLPRPRSHAITSQLIIDGLALDAKLLPKDLQRLTPQIQRWAVGDDVERQERLATAKRGELAKLLKEVGPVLARIDEYLDSFGSAALPDEAVLLGQLAEAVAEVRVAKA